MSSSTTASTSIRRQAESTPDNVDSSHTRRTLVSASSLHDIESCSRAGDSVPAPLLMLQALLAVGSLRVERAPSDDVSPVVEVSPTLLSGAPADDDAAQLMEPANDWKVRTVHKPLFVHLARGRPAEDAALSVADISAATAWPLDVVAAELRVEPARLLAAWHRCHGVATPWPYERICRIRDSAASAPRQRAQRAHAIRQLMLPFTLHDALSE
jgi:hypothetical protein